MPSEIRGHLRSTTRMLALSILKPGCEACRFDLLCHRKRAHPDAVPDDSCSYDCCSAYLMCLDFFSPLPLGTYYPYSRHHLFCVKHLTGRSFFLNAQLSIVRRQNNCRVLSLL